MQSIQFQNTLEDVRNYYEHWAFKTTEGQKRVTQWFLFGQIICLVGALLVWGFLDNFLSALGLWLLFEVSWLMRSKLAPKRWLAQEYIQNWLKELTGSELENLCLPKVMKYSDGLLSVDTQEETHTFSWKRVKRIEKSGNNIFIYCGTKTVFMIPRRAFGSESEFDELYGSLKNKLRDHSKIEFPHAQDSLLD